jgi:ribosomal protein S18 acetylase RimI-like enzyme
MHELRASTTEDLFKAASWMRSAEDCQLWAGARLSFPVDATTVPIALEFEVAESWSLFQDGSLLALGQIVPKPDGRLHLARLIVDPNRRGSGIGRSLATHLLRIALVSGADAVSLNVDLSNAPAIALYTSLGFSETPRPEDEAQSTSLYLQHAV